MKKTRWRQSSAVSLFYVKHPPLDSSRPQLPRPPAILSPQSSPKTAQMPASLKSGPNMAYAAVAAMHRPALKSSSKSVAKPIPLQNKSATQCDLGKPIKRFTPKITPKMTTQFLSGEKVDAPKSDALSFMYFKGSSKVRTGDLRNILEDLKIKSRWIQDICWLTDDDQKPVLQVLVFKEKMDALKNALCYSEGLSTSIRFLDKYNPYAPYGDEGLTLQKLQAAKSRLEWQLSSQIKEHRLLVRRIFRDELKRVEQHISLLTRRNRTGMDTDTNLVSPYGTTKKTTPVVLIHTAAVSSSNDLPSL